MGINPEKETDLLFIAKTGLTSPLPKNWKSYINNNDEVFYFNTSTKEKTWKHPLDDYYKNLVIKTRNENKSSKKLNKPLKEKEQEKNSMKFMNEIIDKYNEDPLNKIITNEKKIENKIPVENTVNITEKKSKNIIIKQEKKKDLPELNLKKKNDKKLSLSPINSLNKDSNLKEKPNFFVEKKQNLETNKDLSFFKEKEIKNQESNFSKIQDELKKKNDQIKIDQNNKKEIEKIKIEKEKIKEKNLKIIEKFKKNKEKKILKLKKKLNEKRKIFEGTREKKLFELKKKKKVDTKQSNFNFFNLNWQNIFNFL